MKYHLAKQSLKTMSSVSVEGRIFVWLPKIKMVVLIYSGAKRKASEEAATPDSKQLIKKARTDSPDREMKVSRLFSYYILIAANNILDGSK